MKTILRLMTITVFAFMLVFAAQAKTVNVADFGAVANDDADDTDAVRAAAQDLLDNGGGTLVFPAGMIDINGAVYFQPNQGLSFRLVGDKGSFVRVNGDKFSHYFIFENALQVEIENLNFIAERNTTLNAQKVIWTNNVVQAKISKCGFYGIGTSEAVVRFDDTSATLEDTLFVGSTSEKSVVWVNNTKGFYVNNVTFKNNGDVLDTSVGKTALVVPEEWIKVKNPTTGDFAMGQGHFRVKDSTFDSAALKSIFVENQKSVEMNGLNISISSVKRAVGIRFQNVAFGEVMNTTFTNYERAKTAIELFNNTYTEFNSLSFRGNVVVSDSDSSSSYHVRYCPACGNSAANLK